MTTISSKQKRAAKTKIQNFFIYLGIVIMCVWAVFPFFWMVLVSLKERIHTYDPSIWFFKPVFDNYVTIFTEKDFLKYLVNSAVISISTTLLALVIGTTAAYGFSRYKFKNSEKSMFLLLAIRMIPSVAIVIPIFIIARFGHMLDSRLLLIIVYLIFNIPFTVWMMKGFFDEIPKELEESAMVDGCSTFKALYKIILPLAQPGLIATSIFCIISAWNEFVFALFLTSIKSVTTPTIVQMFLSITGVAWGEMSAVGTVAILPVLIFAMIVQKNMIRGLSFGAVKG